MFRKCNSITKNMLTYGSLVDVEECVTSPCQNGGTCVEYFGGYACECVAGWTGENCRTGITTLVP